MSVCSLFIFSGFENWHVWILKAEEDGEFCQEETDECLMRRTLAAHVDYIYTQKNKPKPWWHHTTIRIKYTNIKKNNIQLIPIHMCTYFINKCWIWACSFGLFVTWFLCSFSMYIYILGYGISQVLCMYKVWMQPSITHV